MAAYADLEISIHRRGIENYSIELRLGQPGSDADIRLLQSKPSLQFDFDALRDHRLNDARYGQLLAENLFADLDVKAAFTQARSNTQALSVPLRLRLFIEPGAFELHNLRWETLRDPQDSTPLFTGEQILFSRYLSSLDWRPVRLRARTEMSALVVIANPANLAEYQLAPVDVEGEKDRIKKGLGNIRVATLADAENATLNNISIRLRDGYDILYLVCHGALIKGEPQLWLEDYAGNVARTPGSELLTRLRELQQLPRLVVLASCQSAGDGHESCTGDEGALAALGPRMAEAGIPAVLAMQGNISMKTVEQFMPVFFAELQKDGQIDRALAVARGSVRKHPDWWMPVLFMRLKSGCLWYDPGFAGEQREMEKWPALLNNIHQVRCTPILGSGLSESLLGTSREIAQNWADTYHFPMAPYDREDLPQVAQYLAVNQEYNFPRDELIHYIHHALLERYSSDLPQTLHQAPIDKLIEAVGTLRREQDAADPHSILAELPFPIYITTSPDNLLCTALAAAGKEPQCELCQWNEEIELLPSIYDQDPGYRPAPERPLVYQLFGRLQVPDSLVLTEDDYFDYLIGVTSNKDLIPNTVRRALVDTALLFIGFQMDDWNFRVLYRSIMNREGGRRRKSYAHVAVQINPEEGRIVEPERARRYLETYFQGADISIYWGSAVDFLKELQQRWGKIKL